MPRQINDPRDCSEWHLLRELQHERLEQQREAAELANPTRLNQTHEAIGQAHPRHAYFEEHSCWKKLRCRRRLTCVSCTGCSPGNSDISKPGACNEVNSNVELPLSSIEVNTMDVPGSRDAQGGFE